MLVIYNNAFILAVSNKHLNTPRSEFRIPNSVTGAKRRLPLRGEVCLEMHKRTSAE